MKKLAIVGSGSNTRDAAPFDDPVYQIWVFNEAANSPWCKRWDAVFQMHNADIYKGHNTKDPQHWGWLKQKHNKPIYMQETDPEVPDSVAFPLEDAAELVGRKYFSATFAYMMALAKMQGFEQIDIHGMELSASEYQYQAECLRFWIGYLMGAGVQVNLYSAQNLLEAPLYGYEGSFVFGEDFFRDRARKLNNEWNSFEKNAKNVKKSIDKVIERNEIPKLPELISKYQVAIQNTGKTAGALAEAERYQTFGSRSADRGGFEFAAATAQRDGETKRIVMFSKVGLIEYLANIYQQTGNPEAARQLMQQIEDYGKLAEAYGAMLGMYEENLSYIIKYDKMVQANGGLK